MNHCLPEGTWLPWGLVTVAHHLEGGLASPLTTVATGKLGVPQAGRDRGFTESFLYKARNHSPFSTTLSPSYHCPVEYFKKAKFLKGHRPGHSILANPPPQSGLKHKSANSLETFQAQGEDLGRA